MTDEQINTAIAEACGWVDRGSFNYDRPDDHLFKRLKPNSEKYEYRWQHEFNYCTDLNAMHLAEQTIYNHNNLWTAYYYHIGAGPFSLHATARKKAEAFLRTLGKWKEVQK